MIRIFLPLICAALGFAAASCTQSDRPLAPAADAPGSARASSPGATPTAAAAAAATAAATPAATATPTTTAMTPPPDGEAPVPSSDDASTSPVPQGAPAQPADANANPDAPTGTTATTGTTGTAAERRASTLIGMPVVSADGSSLGAVKDIIFDGQGRATHLVIAYDTDAELTAMPWDAAMASIKDGRMVLDGTKLQSAPSFTPDAWPNLDDPTWSATADAYWRKAVRAAIEANPGAPVDPTSRGRARPSRDGG